MNIIEQAEAIRERTASDLWSVERPNFFTDLEGQMEHHFIVSCEYRLRQSHTVEVPVMVSDADADPKTAACERAERIAAEQFGGALEDWFAWKVEVDDE